MTKEPTNEAYPINQEREATFDTEKIFSGVKLIEGHVFFNEFTFAVGRRGNKNAAKGFSTGESKTYCPGTEYTNELQAGEIIQYVTQSVLTNTRHALQAGMGEVSDGKGEEYKERQKTLAKLLAEVQVQIDADGIGDPDVMEVATIYGEFMEYEGSAADSTDVGQAFFSTITLIKNLRSQFTAPEATTA